MTVLLESVVILSTITTPPPEPISPPVQPTEPVRADMQIVAELKAGEEKDTQIQPMASPPPENGFTYYYS